MGLCELGGVELVLLPVLLPLAVGCETVGEEPERGGGSGGTAIGANSDVEPSDDESR